jgi:hypothetical protein
MLIKSFFSFLFLLGSLTAYGQEEEGVFWEITGNNIATPSYLFGTIHLICEEDFNLSEQVADKLSESKALVLEIDMDDPSLQIEMMNNIYNKDGQQITDFLTKEEYMELRTFLKERTGMDLDMLKEMRPMVLMSLIYNNLLACETRSFENELMKLAKAKEIEVVGMETVEDQISLFDIIPLKDQYRTFYTYTINLEKGQREFRKLIMTYREENILKLLNMVGESPEYKDYQDVFLSDRNKNWVGTMSDIMKDGPVFFAVGAGHLAGPDGLISLLKKEGYKIKRINL